MDQRPIPLPPLSAELLREVRGEAQGRGVPLLQQLADRMGVAAGDATAALAARVAMTGVDALEMFDWPAAFDLLPYHEAVRRQCLLFRAGDRLRLVVADPFERASHDWLETALAQPIELCLAHPADIAAVLSRHEEGARAMDSALGAQEGADAGGAQGEELSLKSISEDTSQVVRLVRSTLYDALKSGASDIHLEATPAGLAIRYRIDGVLVSVGAVPGIDNAEQAISRIKVISELDIAERRVPQDGRFRAQLRGRDIDFRVSIMPSIHGEDAVLRILDKESLSSESSGLRLDALGFDEDTLHRIRRLAGEPYGMLLVTGPTGSGKTTTLYGAICEINHGRDKIVTIEDPVEYQLPGVLQIPVNEKKGLSFARGLRSILRHDPDKVMVGEIRDPETAQIAVQAALTGHLVLTTVHANSAFDVIGRFAHMGVDPYSFVSALNGVVAQRLLRLNCPRCVAAQAPSALEIEDAGIVAPAEFRFRLGRGCGECRGTGYRGRKAVAELLVLDDELREMIVAREPIRRLKEAAQRSGTRFLREAALDLVRRGETSLEEANRVTFVA
jgi:general secretion pathway protein E